MTATNHALTGAAIGLIIGSPVAIPAALASHYILDALPHYRPNIPDEQLFKSKGFKRYLIAEACLCFLVVAALFALRPEHWLLAAICAFVAAAPDLLSIGIFRRVRAGKPKKLNPYTWFASKIQWFERPIGAVVEVAWFVAAVAVVSIYI